MKIIRSHILLITLLALLVTSVISWQGLSHEIFANSVYVNILTKFPESLTLRLEPLFLALLWPGAKLIGVAGSIVAWRFILVWLQCYLFDRLLLALEMDRLQRVVGLVLFATSATTFFFADNLLRNFAANTLLLLSLLILHSIISGQSKSKSAILWLGVVLAATVYTHILVATIIWGVVGAATGIGATLYFLGVESKMRARLITPAISLAIAIVMSTPYLSSLYQNSDLSDYRAPSPSPSLIASTTPVIPIQTEAGTFFAPIRRIAIGIFEYRDITLTLGLAISIAVIITVIIFRGKNRSPGVLLISLLWLITYLGTKLDYIDISVLPYRYTLMLSIASLLLLLLGYKWLTAIYSTPVNRQAITIIFLASYLGHNAPIAIENFGLKPISLAVEQQAAERSIGNIIPQNARVIQLGTALEALRPDLTIIDDRLPFEANSNDTAYEDIAKLEISHILFTDSIQNERISDMTSYQWQRFLTDERYVVAATKSFGPYLVYLIEVRPNVGTPRVVKTLFSDNKEAVNFLNGIDPKSVSRWRIHVFDRQLQEEIVTEHEMVVIEYKQPLNAIQPNDVTQQLIASPVRGQVDGDRIWYVYEQPGAVWARIKSNLTSPVITDLSDYGRDVWRMTAELRSVDGLTVKPISRTLFRHFIHWIVAILAIIGFFALRPFANRQVMAWPVMLIVALLLADLIFVGEWFRQFYISSFL